MKKLLTVLTLTLGGLLIVPMQSQAEDAKPAAGERGKEGARRDRVAMMKENLGLTDEQVAKIKPIVEADREKMKALREDSALTADQKKEKFAELFKAQSEQIKPILTPEQQEKWKEQLAKMQERRANAGKPAEGDKK